MREPLRQPAASPAPSTLSMTGDFAPPVKRITKTLDTGIKLGKRVSKSAISASAANALQISLSARDLQRSLERDLQLISNAYKQCVGSYGEPFTRSLVENEQIQSRLKELSIGLNDQINECLDFEDRPDSFDQSAFTNLQRESQRCEAECTAIFNEIQDQLLHSTLQDFRIKEKSRGDGAQLRIMRQTNFSWKPPPPPPNRPPPPSPVSPLQKHTPRFPQNSPSLPAKPLSPWHINSPAQFDIGSPVSVMSSSLGTSPGHLSHRVSPSLSLDEQTPQFIPAEHVSHRLSANEEFLERRRRSRMMFQEELRRSGASIEEYRTREASSDRERLSPSPNSPPSRTLLARASSPTLGGDVNIGFVGSPTLEHFTLSTSPELVSKVTGNGQESTMSRQRNHGARNSDSSSITQSQFHRPDSQASQDSIFGLRAAAAPLSPPLSEHGLTDTDNFPETLATTLRTPDFGKGIEQGLEAVNGIDHGNGLIPVKENGNTQPTPTASVASVEYPMRHDSSFYKFGGFCEGAKAVMRGEPGFTIVKKPAGQFSSTKSARCKSCSYEIGWKEFEKDRNLDRDGIYGNSSIRFRQRFITKSHLRTESLDQPLYACVFCVKEHKTVEEHDATVFFSVPQLFRHLARHSQPLPTIEGINALYGPQTLELLDFDLHFTRPDVIPSQYNITEIASKVATRPAALASITHHPKLTSSTFHDPDGNPTLHFAAGARIVGITFPKAFNGTWCTGYHDGKRGSFPASAITLERPVHEDLRMNAQSSLIAFAKWDFKPKQAKEGEWLSFKKGECISAIGYSYPDHWCWSGQILDSKGKSRWGIFPAAFVEGLREATSIPLPATSPGGLRSGFGAFGRRKSSKQAIMRGPENAGDSVSVLSQPGLEAVPQYKSGWSSWSR